MVKLNSITTKTGDDGTTGLVGGTRISKSSMRIQAIGMVDEVGASLGVALTYLAAEQAALLRHVQNDLFDLGADLATPDAALEGALRISAQQVAWLEDKQAELQARLQPLNSFLLPGGSQAAAYVHLARAMVRRAETHIVALHQSEQLNPHLLQYINRLSDFLFVLGRVLNNDGKDDVLWVAGQHRE